MDLLGVFIGCIGYLVYAVCEGVNLLVKDIAQPVKETIISFINEGSHFLVVLAIGRSGLVGKF